MTPDKMQNLSAMPTRQKVVALITLVVVIIIIWQLIGLFGIGSGSKPKTTVTPDTAKATPATGAKPATTTTTTPPAGSNQVTPQPASITSVQAPPSAQLVQLQQESQAKYLSALNDLQMLKIQRDIAEQNQAIMTAKLSAVQSQKKMVDLLTPPAPPISTQAIKPVATQAIQSPVISSFSAYTVISVSLIQGQWSAVVNNQGNLYSVKTGDILPADGSKVYSIDKSGITLMQKDGTKKRISLVPII